MKVNKTSAVAILSLVLVGAGISASSALNMDESTARRVLSVIVPESLRGDLNELIGSAADASGITKSLQSLVGATSKSLRAAVPMTFP